MAGVTSAVVSEQCVFTTPGLDELPGTRCEEATTALWLDVDSEREVALCELHEVWAIIVGLVPKVTNVKRKS